jgi:hypothetical protein
MAKAEKPLQGKAYGSIPHLPGSKFGKDDKGCPPGEAKFFTEKMRNKEDNIVVTEKLDGTSCGVLKLNDEIIPLNRAGYPCISAKWEQHKMFHHWAMQRETTFQTALKNGQWLMGEWLAQAHGTLYNLENRSPWAVYDMFDKGKRQTYEVLIPKCYSMGLSWVPILHSSQSVCSVETAMKLLGFDGSYGAQELAEGCVWRAECSDGKIYLAKYVRPEKEVGKYLEKETGKEPIWNLKPW